MGMTVTIDEDFHQQKHEAMAQLAQIRDELEESVRLELEEICQKILASAIEMCPKETGALASSISIDETVQAGDFAGFSLHAGDETENPKTGKTTASYAQMVHDGHAMPDGSFWEGVPFLTEAMLMYESEIEACVDRALKEIGSSEPSASKVAEMEKD